MTGSVRSRTALGAAAVVVAALIVASALLVTFLRRSLTNSVESAARTQAAEIAAIVAGPDWDRDIEVVGDDVFVQVLNESAEVIAASANARGGILADPTASEALEVDVPFDDDPFLAVAHGVGAIGSAAPYTVVVGHSLDHVVESAQTIVGLLGIGIPILTAFVGLVAWRIVGRALSPVESIRRQVESMSAEDLDRRVPVPPTRDEIALLARTTNGMLQRLQASYERQRRFVSDASHELRSPISTIRQHAEVAIRRPEVTSVGELAGAVLEEDLRLQRIVEDLLLLARMDEGDPGAMREVVDLDDVVLEGLDRIRRQDRIAVDASRVSAGRVVGDRKQLDRLVGNLLDNAARHARAEVAVSLGSRDGSVVLAVEDDGDGVPESDRESVWRRFERLDEARARDSGGAGLGLAIVAEVAQAHGGSASVAGSLLGGARFEVRIPAAEQTVPLPER